jgi:hypothetical protein
MSDDLDRRLGALLAAPERAPDEAFAARMGRLIRAEQVFRAARRAAWARFGMLMLATASLLLLFVLLARLTPRDSAGDVPLFSPGAAGLLLLGLWLVVAAPLREGLRDR